MKIALILAAVAVVTNVFLILYIKRRGHKSKAEESSNLKIGSDANSQVFLNSVDGDLLKHSAAAELNISIEELDRMSVEEITQLANKKQLIQYKS
jgi:hypothetical protein